MKGFLASLLLISFLALTLMPVIVQGNGAPQIPTKCKLKTDKVKGWEYLKGEKCEGKDQEMDIEKGGAICCVIDTLYYVTGIIFWFFMAIVVLLTIVGAFMITTSGGAPEKVASGRRLIVYAAVGLAVAFLTYFIPGIVKITVLGKTAL